MPIHANTYRHYEGPRRGRLARGLAIARTGAELALKKRRLIVLVLLGILPAIVYGVHVYASVTMNAGEYVKFASRLLGGQASKEFLDAHPGMSGLWTLIFTEFLALWQTVIAGLVVAAVGPSLVSQDLRARAMQIYYSRPITRADYLAGKFLVVAAFIALVTFVPALLLYVVGVALSKDLAVVADTWRVLAGITLGSMVITLVAGVLVLACSALGRRSSHVALAWAALVLLSETAYVFVRDNRAMPWAHLLSIRANVAQAVASIFGGPREYNFDPLWSWVVLAALVAAASAFLYRRVGALEGEH